MFEKIGSFNSSACPPMRAMSSLFVSCLMAVAVVLVVVVG
jgi:hypothetical protein